MEEEMSLIIGIMCLSASLYYGITSMWQKNNQKRLLRIISATLFFVAAPIWLFHIK